MNADAQTKWKTMKNTVLTFMFALGWMIFLCSEGLAQAADQAKEIARDGRFIAYDNGTVVDTETGLTWASKDDGKGLNEKDAVEYCQNYKGGGYNDWRMPSLEELKTIFDPLTRNRSGYHVTKLIDITAELVWALEGPSTTSTFNFVDGSKGTAFYEGPGSGTWYRPDKEGALITRALPVRGVAKTRAIRKAKEIGRDAQFIAYENGTVVDTETDLMWASKDDGKGLTFKDAKIYFDDYRGGGYTDWRIPRIKELKTIYDLYTKNRHGFHVTELIDITGERVWALDKVGEASGFSFVNGKWVAIELLKPRQRNLLALPVRSSREPEVHRVKLRSDPKLIWQDDIEKMLNEHNFFAKYLNDEGSFPNDFMDNGDGTVTDHVTGLMWEKAGSSSILQYHKAQQRVKLLNKEEYLGYEDWRIPTIEELSSLLEPKKNEKGKHINALFNPEQKTCWSSDHYSQGWRNFYHIVDFSRGKITWGVARADYTFLIPDEEEHFVRAVRSIVKKPKTIQVKLRSTPLVTVDSDVEMMIRERNFFVKNRNDKGEFPNDFVDNGDGTITDRITGLVWEKGGSSTAMFYWSAKKYVSRLNKERSGGYNDWRIPTTEELASLLERERNDRALYIAPLFDGGQKAYWTSDTTPAPPAGLTRNRIIDFSKGNIDFTNSKSEFPNLAGFEEDRCFIRAVRSIE